ncbi:MAG TPA: TauD/TfdA family dioxygenase [Caulobacteraceae bacterium]
MSVTASGRGFGAEIGGVDLGAALQWRTLDAVKAAFAEHGVIAFPDQPMSHDQLEAFTLQFGDLGVDPKSPPWLGIPTSSRCAANETRRPVRSGAPGAPTGASRRGRPRS